MKFLARPFEHLEVAAPRRVRARRLVPRAVVLARHQHLEAAALRRERARRLVPRVRSRAPTSAPGGGRRPPLRTRTRPRPRAFVPARPLQLRRWPLLRRERARHPRPTGSRSRAPTSASSRWPPCAATALPSVSRRTLRSRALHDLGWPPLAALARVLLPRAAVLRAHFSTSRWPLLRRTARLIVPRAAVLARPLQHLEVAALRRVHAHVHSSHGQSFSRAHFGISRWPPSPRPARPLAPSGSRSLSPTSASSRWPPFAAYSHVFLFHGQPPARPLQHLEVVRSAAFAHVHSSHGQSFSRAHLSIRACRPAPPQTPRRVVFRPHRVARALTSAPRAGRPPPPPSTSTRPTAAVLARPLQRLEAAASRCVRARRLRSTGSHPALQRFNSFRSPFLAAAAHTR